MKKQFCDSLINQYLILSFNDMVRFATPECYNINKIVTVLNSFMTLFTGKFGTCLSSSMKEKALRVLASLIIDGWDHIWYSKVSPILIQQLQQLANWMLHSVYISGMEADHEP